MSDQTIQNKRAGFTLIELMVVVAIIGLLVSMAAPSVTAAMTRARSSEVKMVKTGIEKSARDAFMRSGFQWPPGVTTDTGGEGFIFNPPFDFAAAIGPGAPGSCRIGAPARWDTTSAAREGWKWLDFVPEGLLRGRYEFTYDAHGTFDPANCYQSLAITDLDYDGNCFGRFSDWCMRDNGDWFNLVDVVYSSATWDLSDDGQW